MLCLDDGRRLAARSMHDVRAVSMLTITRSRSCISNSQRLSPWAEEYFGAAGDVRHQAELLGQGGEIERLSADGETADNLQRLGGPPPGNARKTQRAATDILQRDESGGSRQRGGIADFTQQGERADHQAVVGALTHLWMDRS
jgi:hypothetical protein